MLIHAATAFQVRRSPMRNFASEFTRALICDHLLKRLIFAKVSSAISRRSLSSIKCSFAVDWANIMSWLIWADSFQRSREEGWGSKLPNIHAFWDEGKSDILRDNFGDRNLDAMNEQAILVVRALFWQPYHSPTPSPPPFENERETSHLKNSSDKRQQIHTSTTDFKALTVKLLWFCSNALQMRRSTWGGRLELFAKLAIMPTSSVADIEDMLPFAFSTNMLNQLSFLFQQIITETISRGSVISL